MLKDRIINIPKKYFGFIYCWIDLTNGKTYTGSHEGLITDNYIGSGILFKKAYRKRPDKFSRKILEYVIENNKKKLLEIEQNYLGRLDWDNTYNLSSIAGGGNTRSKYTEKQLIEYSQTLSKATKGKNKGKIPWNAGLKTGPHTKERKQKQSERQKGNIPWNKGLKVTCPFCNKYGGALIMKRWHFENCKENK